MSHIPVEPEAEELSEKVLQKMNIGVIRRSLYWRWTIRNGELAPKPIINNPNITVVIPGMDSLEQVNTNASV